LTLDDYSFLDPRVALIRAEQLSPFGLAPEGRAMLAARAGWGAERLDLFDEGFRRYWSRASALARRAPELPEPRLRNVAVVGEPESVRPFGQMLNQSTWTMFDADFDPALSHPELVAYLLVHGDRLVQIGEVTFAPVHLAPYWFERSPAERDAFARAAALSPRPDAGTYRAIAAALGWLRELRHERVRPPRRPAGHRAIPGTGLLVPRALEREPERLVESARSSAEEALREFYARWRTPRGDAEVRRLLDWLVATAPPLVVAAGERAVWDPERPHDVAALARELSDVGQAAARDVREDLAVVAERSTRFLRATVAADALPVPEHSLAQSGYVYVQRGRRLLAYNLHEPAVERLAGPALPYARSMLGARALHEWAHLAVEAGWVPCADESARGDALRRLAEELDAAVARAPRAVRERADRGLQSLSGSGSAGERLAALFATRLPDYQANVLARRFWSDDERETYVRQNVRSLRGEYPAERLWALLVRYVYELQYLEFSQVADRRAYFVEMTGFERDFAAPRVVSDQAFESLCAAARAVCRSYAVDESRFRASVAAT